MLQQAQAEDSANPRLAQVVDANRWYDPPERGGSQDLAIETHQKGLQAARFHKSEIADPLAPSWGEPELLLNLAWANLRRNSPDLVAAEQ
jgi:hypothetical protein